MSDYWRGVVRWDNEDVICAAFDEGKEMTVYDAENWWNKYERTFKSLLVEYGNQVIRNILNNEVDDN